MTQAVELPGAGRASHVRVVGAVSAAHFVSHYYIILLAPLLPFVRADYGVSYTEIGIAFAAFNVVSALLQTPAGFLVDRFGARVLLIGGLLLGATALMVAGLVNSFWVMVAMFAVAGVGNTVYHPADYALLSQHVPAKSIGQAFSIHSFAGMLGSGVAPASLLLLHGFFGWRGAFVGAAIMGFAAAVLLVVLREEPAMRVGPRVAEPAEEKSKSGNLRLLTSAPILLNLLFFALLAMISSGISNYSVVALGAMYGTSVSAANAALSAYLLLSSAGVLAGGVLVSRTTRHGAVTAIGLALMTLLTVLAGEINLGELLLIAAMAVNGFFFGFIMPSRDMIVREVTPADSFGKVFGFVTTGFNIGGVVSPLIFGALMDHGSPRMVFLLVAASTLLAIVTVATQPRRPAA
jgi:MFS family permease